MRVYFIIVIIFCTFTACNQPQSGDVREDSLAIQRADTPARRDTMNYERMQHRTAPADSFNTTGSARGDTAYYERLPHRNQSRKDSSAAGSRQ